MTVSEKEYLQKLGNRIVEIREKKNLKQYELSDLLDIDVRVLRRIEKGKTNVQILFLLKITKVLDIELNSLIKP
ncbi:helix-turn-helix domain-containing protein [Pontimicrobium sp. MEBiC01747]